MKIQTIVLALLFVSCGRQVIDLSDMHSCEATLIQDTDDAFVLYAENIGSCGALNIIALEKFNYRDDNGKAHYLTIDTLTVKIKPDQILTTTHCNDWTEQHIILGSDPKADNFGTIIKAWTVNSERTRLIESNPEQLDCLNENLIE